MSDEKHPASNVVAVRVLGLDVSTDRQDGLSEDREWSAAHLGGSYKSYTYPYNISTVQLK